MYSWATVPYLPKPLPVVRRGFVGSSANPGTRSNHKPDSVVEEFTVK